MPASETKAIIRESLLSLLLEKDIQNISVMEVTKRAGIARSTFYLHYDSVYSALQEVEDDFFGGMKRMVGSASKSAMFNDCYFHVPNPLTIDVQRFARNNAVALRALLGKHGEELFQYRFDNMLRVDLAESAIKAGYLKVVPGEEDAIAAFIVNGLRSLLMFLSMHPYDIEESRFAVLTYRLLYGPFRHWDDQA